MRMRSQIIIFPVLLLLLFVSCNEEKEAAEKEYILTEKDLIPEGVAFDPATKTIYISSTHKRKIVSIDKNGKIGDFIREMQDDIKSVIGMEVDPKRNCLWAVSSEANDVLPLKNPGPSQWKSSVYQYDLSGKLMKQYKLNRDSVFLNDLTVAPDGTVYITESRQRGVYRIQPGKDSVEFFLSPAPYNFMNGICFTDKTGHLFVSSREGIIDVDLSTGMES
jgi:sugar lactone lactonase YvrE